jgi:hypothetical protein
MDDHLLLIIFADGFLKKNERMNDIMKVKLLQLAHGRSGDKGDTANVGIIAYRAEFYPFLKEVITVERVKQHFAGICKGEVERYELPNIWALNFLLHNALGGGGTQTLRHDAQGKTFSTAFLRMEVEVPDELAEKWKL